MRMTDEKFVPQQPEEVTLLNGTQVTKVGTLESPRRNKEIFQKGTRFYYYSHLQMRLFPISKKDLGL